MNKEMHILCKRKRTRNQYTSASCKLTKTKLRAENFHQPQLASHHVKKIPLSISITIHRIEFK